jgi:NO-binding membrane sensor protein with MHYT domain
VPYVGGYMSHELHHFTMGFWVLPLAYVMAVVGSYVGLSCVRQALRFTTVRAGMLWLVMASVSIGGVGIWLMHFIGMMGFAVPASAIRYNLALTVLSAALAVIATLFGLGAVVGIRLISTRRLDHLAALVVGGLVMGLAVSLMHYSGMAAIRIQGTLEYDPMFVAASVIIGIVASTAALRVAGLAERLWVRVAAALIMGCAVVAMHYTGMAGVQATVDPTSSAPSGVTVMALLFPAFVIGVIVLAVPIVALLLVIDPVDVHVKDSIARWTEAPEPETAPAYDPSSAPTEVIIIPDEYRQTAHRPRFQPGPLHPALREPARHSALRQRLARNTYQRRLAGEQWDAPAPHLVMQAPASTAGRLDSHAMEGERPPET